MSYEHLTGRLIETQRSMIGGSAIDIARSVEGITVTGDGNVTAVTGDERAVVGELARRYTDMLGEAAERRLVAAAREFETELVLPPALGGPEDRPEPVESHDEVSRPGPSAAATGTVSDGGTVTLHSPTSSPADEFSGAIGDSVEAATGESAVAVSEPVKVGYTVASSVPRGDDAGLDDVYLLPLGGDGWRAPITVADAITAAVAEATGVREAHLGGFVGAVDPVRLFATLDGETGETVSFHANGVTITFHRTGSLAIH